MDKVVGSPAEAVSDIPDGASLAVGGFGLCGVPIQLIAALHEHGVGDLETVSNNCGVDGEGLGVLLMANRIRKTTGSYVGENKEFERQFLQGELDPVDVHTPGVFVQRVVVVGEDGKRIERRTVRSRTEES